MAKRIDVLPIEDIELCFNNDKVITMNFGMKALGYLSELGLENEDIESTLKGESVSSLCASIIYAGAKTKDENFTLDNAKEVVACLDLDSALMIIDIFQDSLGEKAKEKQREMQKNFMSQFLMKLAK